MESSICKQQLVFITWPSVSFIKSFAFLLSLWIKKQISFIMILNINELAQGQKVLWDWPWVFNDEFTMMHLLWHFVIIIIINMYIHQLCSTFWVQGGALHGGHHYFVCNNCFSFQNDQKANSSTLRPIWKVSFTTGMPTLLII